MQEPGITTRVTTGSSKETIAEVVNAISGVESGGRANAKNSRSSATGLGQFISSTWMSLIKKYRPDLMKGRSEQEVLALRTDPEISREMLTRFTEQNATALKNAGIPITKENLYLAHHFGTAGAKKIYNSSDDTKMSSILSQRELNANPYLKNMTVGELRANHSRRLSAVLDTPSSKKKVSGTENCFGERKY